MTPKKNFLTIPLTVALKRGMEMSHLDEDQVQDVLKKERQVAADRRFFDDDKLQPSAEAAYTSTLARNKPSVGPYIFPVKSQIT